MPSETGDDKLEDTILIVDIPDALSEEDKVKFTIKTKTNMPEFQQKEFSVVRQHEEFIWLYNSICECEDYEGYLIPPAPPHPNFNASREKLQKLNERESSMTKDEINKMKQELEAEYLAIFKKTVAMHDTFLEQLANHPIFRKDNNFHIFLQFNGDLSVRSKNAKEHIESVWNKLHKVSDEIFLPSKVKDIDENFHQQRQFTLSYLDCLKDASVKFDKVIRLHKNVAQSYQNICTSLLLLGTVDLPVVDMMLTPISKMFDSLRALEFLVSSDLDLKIADTLCYAIREGSAVNDLLLLRLHSLDSYEQANRYLERMRTKNKEINLADEEQQKACARYEKITNRAKNELQNYLVHRISTFKKNLNKCAEFQMQHAKSQETLLKNCLVRLQGNPVKQKLEETEDNVCYESEE